MDEGRERGREGGREGGQRSGQTLVSEGEAFGSVRTGSERAERARKQRICPFKSPIQRNRREGGEDRGQGQWKISFSSPERTNHCDPHSQKDNNLWISCVEVEAVVSICVIAEQKGTRSRLVPPCRWRGLRTGLPPSQHVTTLLPCTANNNQGLFSVKGLKRWCSLENVSGFLIQYVHKPWEREDMLFYPSKCPHCVFTRRSSEQGPVVEDVAPCCRPQPRSGAAARIDKG
ncbi:unnamed protein product [Pleuronectes platessa]|uniref:Uncharacterized protein n=1 Tax=Pleuronectes platessa TaxID=8262 RepID=A0A9N7VPP2_PLEPL|nr:unnamed protein product [Pleuronectes platessa]